MVKIREEQTEKLEEAASKGMKFGGFKNMKLSSKISLILLVLVALTAILAPIIAPHDPLEIFTARQAPGNGFLFGTDDKGRDILSRMLYGGRYSLVIGFGATLFALFFGSIIGAIAAVARKSISEVIMRLLDIIMSVPGIALAAVLVLILATPFPQSSSPSVLCTRRKSPASCVRTSFRSTVRTTFAPSLSPVPRLRGSLSSTSCATASPRLWSSP